MDGFVIATSLSGFVQVRQEGGSFVVEAARIIKGWRKVARIFDREKAIKFMETWSATA